MPVPLLELHQVSKNFRRKDAKQGDLRRALVDVSFTVSQGEFVSIIGPSGCGKSTLLRIIAGLILPSSGQCLHKGSLVNKPSLERGLVFQEPRLLPWLTVTENIALAGTCTEDLLRMMDLQDFRHALPDELSGGMASRVALARALAPSPDLLLLDEPLANLDQKLRSKLQVELRRIWKERAVTCLLVTHDIEEALALGTRLIVLSKRPGRILLDQPLDGTKQRDTLKELILRGVEEWT